MDKPSLDRIQLMHPSLREELNTIYIEICKALTSNTFCRFTYTLRTFAEQDALYAKGRTETGKKVTNARGGYSYHNYGLAVDIALIDGKSANWDVEKDFDGDGLSDWMEIVHIFKSFGWSWGGDWKFSDKPHFEKTFGMSVRQLLFQVENKHLVPNTNYPLLNVSA